jgi:predicted O-linked N-acetylglucosamine transferase (SPINDLY family)
MAYFDDPEMIRITVSEWIKRFRSGKSFNHLTNENTKYDHSKIKVGYLSCDFRMHAVCFLSAQIYELHDRNKFEVFAYDFSKPETSSWRQRIIDGVDHFIPIHEMGDEEVAHLIRSQEIDILIDMVGLTSGARPGILMYKPSPVQISYLGFLGPVGMEEIDYLICDDYVVPDQFKDSYGAKKLCVPFYQVNNRLRESNPKPSRASQGLPENVFVYCVINNSYKITQEVFFRWMNILKKTDNTVLWVLEENESVRESFIDEANRLSVSLSRIIFGPPVDPKDYLARFQCADLFLDTSPYNAGITASDALWMNLPVITCPGNTFTSRMAADLLINLNLEQLVCSSWAEYEEKAILFSKSNFLKQYLSDKDIRSNRVFDSEFFVKSLESKYLEVVTSTKLN